MNTTEYELPDIDWQPFNPKKKYDKDKWYYCLYHKQGEEPFVPLFYMKGETVIEMENGDELTNWYSSVDPVFVAEVKPLVKKGVLVL